MEHANKSINKQQMLELAIADINDYFCNAIYENKISINIINEMINEIVDNLELEVIV